MEIVCVYTNYENKVMTTYVSVMLACNNDTCSDHGTCVNDVCQCDRLYSGKFCQYKGNYILQYTTQQH